MSILIQSKTLSITDGLRAFVEQHIKKFLRRGQRIQEVTIFLETVGRRKKNDTLANIAKIKLSLPGKDVVVERKAHDLYQAILEACLSANRQLRKTKEKRLHRRLLIRHGQIGWA